LRIRKESGTSFARLLIRLEERKTYKPRDDNQLS
uniref:Transposase n=1 Tax=Rodentolepis nana TaxID=102285 RepID=A0A0R3TEH4_RODNA